MNNKTKFTLTVTAMAMVTLIAIVSIIAVFAARTQNFTSNITVKYTASQIAGKVSAKYYVGPDDTTGTDMTTTGREGGETELIFRPQDRQLDPNTLNPLGDIVLDVEDTALNIPDKSWVVFEYVFQNGLGTKVDTDYIAKLAFNGTADNVVVTTNTAGNKIEQANFSTITSSVSNSANFTSSMQVDHNPEPDYVTTKYFYVKVAIDAIGASSTFTGNFTWDLTQAPSPTLDKLNFYLDFFTQSFYRVGLKDYDTAGNVVIPSSYTGEDGISRPVTEIAGISGENITSIYIPDSITTIASISGPNLTELTIPSSVTTIQQKALSGLTGLKVLNYNAVNAQIDTLDSPETPTIFGGDLGKNASGTSVIIGDTVESIPNNFLRYERHVTNLTIDNGVKTIGEYAFYSCAGLTSELIIPDSVLEIGQSAFGLCFNLQKLTIGKGVQTFGHDSFYCLRNLTNLNYNAVNAQCIDDNGWSSDAFSSSGYQSGGISIIIGEDVESIGDEIFMLGRDSYDFNEIIIESEQIYKAELDRFSNGSLVYSLKIGGKVKVLSTADDGTNEFFNNESRFEKSTEENGNKQYNVYTLLEVI